MLSGVDENAEESINISANDEEREPAPRPKRAKRHVRVLLDARTELTDKELKDARDNYLMEQARLRAELDEQRYNKEAAERARDLLCAPPAMCRYDSWRVLVRAY